MLDNSNNPKQANKAPHIPSGQSNDPPSGKPEDAAAASSTENSAAQDASFKPKSVSDNAATAAAPESQLAKDEATAEEVENRRARLSSNLLEQRHRLIEILGFVILAVIVGLYIVFGLTVISLLLNGTAFDELNVTSLILIAMTGSIPTILSITLMVGLFAKDKDQSKEEKSILDASLAAKVCFELVKFLKAPH